MRDGIFKDLPLPRAWRSLMRAAGRPAERGETARRFAEKALARDLNQEVPSVSRVLDQLAGNGQKTLPGFEAPAALGHARGELRSPLEQAIVAAGRRLESEGVHGSALKQQSLSEGINEWAERRLRHIEQHGLAKAGSQAWPALSAAREAVTSAISPVTQSVLSGTSSASSAVRRPVDLDEDLTKLR